MNHGNTSFSTEIFAGATINEVQYLAPLRYRENLGMPSYMRALDQGYHDVLPAAKS
jgi:hypothetical protein